MSSPRLGWALLLGCAACYILTVIAAAPSARVGTLEGLALEEATRHRDHGDVDLAIQTLEEARLAGGTGETLLGSLGIAYVDVGQHDTAAPLLAAGLAGLREREDLPWAINELRKNVARGLFACHLRRGQVEEARTVALEEGGYMPPYVSMALAWDYPELADELIQFRLSEDVLEVAGSERFLLSLSAVSVSVARGDLSEARERWELLTAGIDRQRSSPLKIIVEEAATLKSRMADAAPGAESEEVRLSLAQTYFRLGLTMRGLDQITGPLEPDDPASRIEALRLQVEAWEGLGVDDRALEARQRLVRAAPDDLEARWGLAQDLRTLALFDAAEVQLLWVLRREPERGRAWLLLGDVYRRTGAYDAACDAYAEGIDIITQGRLSPMDEGVEAGGSSLMHALLTGCEDLADVSRRAGRPSHELLAWEAILELAYRPGKTPTQPPADWLAERARYRVTLLTGEEPPPLPRAEEALGGALFQVY